MFLSSRFAVEVTLNGIVDEILSRLDRLEAAPERVYMVEVTQENFQEVVKTPKQSVLLLAYESSKSLQE